MAKINNKEHHTFISNFINNESVVVDLGAYKLSFSKFIRNKYGSKIYAVEAVPSLYKNIKDESGIKVFNYCITDSNDVCKINVPEKGCASNKTNKISGKEVEVQGITLDKLLKDNNIEKVDLLKIDIEGAEIEMFKSLSKEIFEKIDQITIEFHDFLWPDMKPKVESIKKNIKKSGFYCIPFSITNNGDLLFIKRNLISRLDYYYLKFFKRYIMGVLRKVKKIF